MLRSTCLMAVAGAMLLAAIPLSAEEAKPDAAKPPELKTLTLMANADFKDAQLPKGDFQAVAAAAKAQFKDAKAKHEDNTLVISIPVAHHEANTRLADVELQSDCPNNSQYHVTPKLARTVQEGRLQSILLDWTRFRHNAMEAPKLAIHVREVRKGVKNYDVQLNLQKHAAVMPKKTRIPTSNLVTYYRRN